MAAARDYTGVALWWGLSAGAVLTATADGDLPHLRSMLFAGVIIACGSGIGLLSRWVSRGQIPGSVTPITDAPTALELAADNERRIEELELQMDVADTKFTAVMGAIDRRNQASGLPVPDKEETQPIRRLTVVPRGEASLCRLAVAAALALRRADRPGVPL